MSSPIVTFDSAQLAAMVERLPLSSVDELPFGAVHLDANGTVLFFSKREAELSGLRDRPVTGLNFFHDVAPCMNNPKFKGRVDAAVAVGRLDLEFNHTGDFADRNRTLHVRAQSGSDGSIWLFLAR